MSHSHPCNLTWPPPSTDALWGLTGDNRCYGKSWGTLEGRLTNPPSVFKINQMCRTGDITTPSSSGSTSALPSPAMRGRGLSDTDDHISLFASAWHQACTAWASVNNVHKQETMVACKSPSTGKHHVGNNVSQRWLPAPEEVIASSPGDMNLSLLNNTNHYPDARDPT